jgi:PHP family Zn ribbon phosphoesterase
MNWQIKELDERAIISFSDAHSGPKLGREATVLSFDGSMNDFGYDHLYAAITEYSRLAGNPTLQSFIVPPESCHIDFTLEFFPEEGKYHYSGHRACGIRWGPEETIKLGTVCPVCGKNLTQGVVQRISELSGRTEADLHLIEVTKQLVDSDIKLCMTASSLFPQRPPYLMLVPLKEIIAECLHCPVTSKKIIPIYDQLITTFGNEFAVFLRTSTKDIETLVGEKIAVAIQKVREADIYIDPGYDGVFGVVKIWKNDDVEPLLDTSKQQLSLL